MSEKNQQVHPLAPPSNVMPRSDEIPKTTPPPPYSAANGNYYNYHPESMEVINNRRKKKRMQRLASLALLTIFIAGIILVIALVFARVRSPRVRLGYVRASNIINSSGTGNGNVTRVTMQLRMRNRNFGRYKYDNTVATLRRIDTGESVGEFMISEGRVRSRSTRKIYGLVDIRMGNENGSGSGAGSVRMIRIEANFRGKVEIFRVFKRRKSAEMNCTMAINLQSFIVQDLNCNS